MDFAGLAIKQDPIDRHDGGRDDPRVTEEACKRGRFLGKEEGPQRHEHEEQRAHGNEDDVKTFE